VTPGEPVARKTPLWVPDNSHGGGVKEELCRSGPFGVNTMGKNQSQKPGWSLGALFMAVVPPLTVAREICSQMAIWVHGQMFAWSEGHMTTQTHGHMVILSRGHMVVLQMVR
jgi:hypothetical protein